MMRATIIGAAVAIALLALVLALVVSYPAGEQEAAPAAATLPPGSGSPRPDAPAGAHPGFLYGRVTVDGATYEGRLRWGRDQEAFWGDYFDGTREENPWAVHAPMPQPAKRSIEILGFRFGGEDRSPFQRQFLARFGDIARIDPQFRDVRVTLKSGTAFVLDRFAAGDIDDGVRVWDLSRGVVDLDSRQIRAIEFLPTAPLAGAPGRLHGVVRTRQGEFTGFIHWNQQDSVSTDTLDGRADGEERSLRYDTIRSIARQSRDAVRVTLLDGQVMVLSGSRETGQEHRGIYVDGTPFGRVLITWEVFEGVEFGARNSGPGYEDFPPGRPLSGQVTTRDGRRFAGRLVYDFDESETTETLDVSFRGVAYAIPFARTASIVPPGVDGTDTGRVVLDDGEVLAVERGGDVGDRNAGILIFVAGRERPEYVPWAEVAQVEFDR
jgi:hypothetical protein